MDFTEKNVMHGLLLGCIADDFTGAADAASFLKKGGMETVLFNGVPDSKDGEELEETGMFEAAVIALKTRTAKRTDALKDIHAAYEWLRGCGCGTIFFKYCSTFDSGPTGNIGPVVDFLLEEMGADFTVLSPALPVNGRTVKDGGLFVNGVPLNESPMKDHPLTPMREYQISKLMERQGKYECFVLGRREMEKPSEEILKDLRKFGEGKEHFYVVPDYEKVEDAKKIVEIFGGLPLLTGSSGLMEELAKRLRGGAAVEKADHRETAAGSGRTLILAGSCSKMTLAQIEYILPYCSRSEKLKVTKLADGELKVQLPELADMGRSPDGPVLIYSSALPDEIKNVQKYGVERISALFEMAFASLAVSGIAHGYDKLIVAGGETSGAVTKALGLFTYRIGDSIAPGVPVLIPVGKKKLRLVLKSGNFGDCDFFLKAVQVLTR